MPGAKLKYPYTWRTLTDAEKKERGPLYQNPLSACGEDVIVSQPDNLVFPKHFADIAEDIYNMEVRPDDVWVLTYPKCGTTWTQEMVWQIRHNFDVEGGKEHLNLRFPFLEIEMFIDPAKDLPEDMKLLSEQMKIAGSFSYAQQMPSPRCIKSHLPLQMLPPSLVDTCKVVAVARNPKDCCVSFYHHERLISGQGYTGDFPSYAKLFKGGKLVSGEYWYFMEGIWKYRSHPNFRLLWFEDMKKDLIPIIRDLSSFLGKHLTELKVLQLDDHLYFDNFKKNPAVNMAAISSGGSDQAFIRKGKVGDWKNHFTPETNREWNKWIQEKKVKHGIEYEFANL